MWAYFDTIGAAFAASAAWPFVTGSVFLIGAVTSKLPVWPPWLSWLNSLFNWRLSLGAVLVLLIIIFFEYATSLRLQMIPKLAFEFTGESTLGYPTGENQFVVYVRNHALRAAENVEVRVLCYKHDSGPCGASCNLPGLDGNVIAAGDRKAFLWSKLHNGSKKASVWPSTPDGKYIFKLRANALNSSASVDAVYSAEPSGDRRYLVKPVDEIEASRFSGC